MDTNNELKNLAQAAAAGIPLSEVKTSDSTEEVVSKNESNSNYSTEQVAKVGDTEVVIAPPRPKITAPANPVLDEAAHQLMQTPSPMETSTVAYKPTAVGLDDSALETPSMPGVHMGDTRDDLEELHYNSDGTYSAGQLKLMEEHLKGVDLPDQKILADPIFQSVDDELRKMITTLHMGVDEAKTVVKDQIIHRLDAARDKYLAEHSDRAEIVIDKSANVDDLQLTREEHEKLEKVKRVRLIVVDDEDLKHLNIERPDERHKADYVKSIEGSISKYAVPLPMLGDFVSFKGAQIVQMINVVNYEDSTIDEITNMKASLIYDKLVNGSILKRFDADGKSRMSYTEFINKFPYQDIDMALFGILCASSMEESSTSLTCEKCSHTWTQRYNIKSLLHMDHLSDYYKGRINDIIANKTNDLALMDLHEQRKKASRYKSPFTGNIYDVSYPTVARAINLLKRIDEKDPVMTYNSAVALYLSRILVYNKDKESYVPVTAEETDLMLDTVLTLSNEDMNLLANQIRSELFYNPQFVLDVECPSCHNKNPLQLTIENLIFLKAQDSMVEIE